jgi:hypothetical protein
MASLHIYRPPHMHEGLDAFPCATLRGCPMNLSAPHW